MNWMEIFMGVTALFSVVTFAYTVQAGRSRASRKELEAMKVEDRAIRELINRHGDRLTTIETQIKHLPSVEIVSQLTNNLSQMNGAFQRMAGEFHAVKKQVERMDEFLRQK